MSSLRGRVRACGLALLLAAATAASAVPQESTAVEVAMRAGDRVESVLAALNARGYRIVYSSALVRPEMRLRTPPPAAPIEDLLRAILSPWNLRAVRAANGDWLIAAGETADSAAAEGQVDDIAAIDVTATRMRLAIAGAGDVFLDRQDVERIPHLADDAIRMLKVLPGVSGGDFSAALNIRGGRREEAQLTIDGAEIHNAFHFRDIDGALSVLDTNLVESIDFTTGGMTVDLGDTMSGAVGLQTRRPLAGDDYHHGVGISFVSAYGRSSGNFGGERGSWLISARRGFLDVLTKRVVEDDEQLTPRYTDVFAAVGYDIGERTALNARCMLSDDDLKFYTDDDNDNIDSAGKGHSMHLWLTLDHEFSDALRSRTLFAAASVRQTRDAVGTEDRRAGTVHSDNDFRFLDLRQDWSWELSETQMPRWGFNFGDHRGEYDYSLFSSIFDPLITPVPIDTQYDTRMDVDMRKAGVYAAWRTRLTPQFTAELGVRWDGYRYGGEADFGAVSPRVNAVYAVGDAGEIRAAWGVMHQPQAVNELQVEDGVTRFFAPERVRQAVIGYTQRFSHGLSARLDVYDKAYEELRPRFENALDSVQLIPEGAADRIRIDAPEARARGVELTLRRAAERGLAGWISLGWARAEDFDDGEWRPRSWEQRESMSFGGSWTGARWNLALAGMLHSGTPTTSLGIEATPLPGGGYDVEGEVGPRNGDRLGSYARVDMRVNRDVSMESGKLTLYLEITNLLNRRNDCCVEDYRVRPGRGGAPALEVEVGSWLPLLPSFGFQWEF